MADRPDHVYATVRIALLAVVVVLQAGIGFTPLLTFRHEPMWAAVSACAAFAVVTATAAVWVLRRRPLPAAVVAACTAVVAAASAVATAALPPGGVFHAPHWSFGLAGWQLVLLLLDRKALLGAVFGGHIAVSVAQSVHAGLSAPADVGAAGVFVLSGTTVQVTVVLATYMLHHRARHVAALAAARDRVEVRAALAEQWEQDQRAGFAEQLGLALPLLAGLADGEADPGDEDVRRRCALAATQLRRLFAEHDAEHDAVPDPLVHEVSACVDVAQRRGVLVSLAVSGTAVPVPRDVRRDLTGPVVAALAATRERARVSVLRTADEVRVAVITDAGGLAAPSAASTGVAVDSDVCGEHTMVEARWRTS
ncbi:hypothetical protein [Actinophytocola sp. KF-1]